MELSKLLDLLSVDLRLDVLKVLSKFKFWIGIADDMTDSDVLELVANAFLHEIVRKLKKHKKDGPVTRGFALEQTISLFALDEDWSPDWLMKPFAVTSPLTPLPTSTPT